jgi:hypothetical protein
MEISQTTYQQIFALRLEPLVQNIFKKKKWRIAKTSSKRVLDLVVQQFISLKIDEFMVLTDDNLLYQIYQMLESRPIADYLASIDLIEIKRSNFDIRHKETLRLCIQEYFKLFLPNLASKMNFDTIQFLDKELIALFGGEHRITDALILVKVIIDNKEQTILIHWEQQSNRKTLFEEGMFHSFCGIYFQFRKLVFPIAMFTDQARWEKPIKDSYKLKLLDYPINEYHYHLIKLKSYKSDDFEKIAEKNPLAFAYLPLTDYDKAKRPYIKAKAVNGILTNYPDGQKRATLISLVDESIQLNPDEQKTFDQVINEYPNKYQEVKMFQSLEEYLLYKGKTSGLEEGRKEGRKEGQEELIARLIELEILKESQIGQILPVLGLHDTSKILDKISMEKKMVRLNPTKLLAT